MTSNINEIIENSPEWIRKLPSERKGELSGTLYDADVAHLPKNLREEVLQVANLAEHLNEAISSDMKEEKRAESQEVLKKIVPILQDHLSLIETEHGENPKAQTSIEKIRDLLTRSAVSITQGWGLEENKIAQEWRKKQFIEPSFSSPDAAQGMKDLSMKTASELLKSLKIFKDNNSENIQNMCSSDENNFTAVEEGFQKLNATALSSCNADEVPIITTVLDSEFRKLKMDSAEKFFANPLTESLQNLSPKLRADKDIVFIAVAHDGLAPCDADESLKKDEDVVLKAIENNYQAFFYADDILKKDKDFVIKAIGRIGNSSPSSRFSCVGERGKRGEGLKLTSLMVFGLVFLHSFAGL